MTLHLTFDSCAVKQHYISVGMRLYCCVAIGLVQKINVEIRQKHAAEYLLGVAYILGLVGPGRLGVILEELLLIVFGFLLAVPFSLSVSVLRFFGQSIPSPRGFPLPQKTGNGQSHLFPPKICDQFVSAPMSYRL